MIIATAAIEELLFDISEALLVPVLILTVAALAMVLVEVGSLLVEVRRAAPPQPLGTGAGGRGVPRPPRRRAARPGAGGAAAVRLEPEDGRRPRRRSSSSAASPQAEARIAKRLAEYDYLSLRRLERTRILVRMGPALGLMGTLIPLSPALAGLADGDVATLTENLRVAFSVTVAGLMIGAFAFGVSLVRDRLYAQDYSDVEYVAVSLTDARRQRHPGRPPQPLGGGAVKVTPRARSRDDRAGDPLDGLVNLFDLGIVLSVAFLLAALSSLDLTEAITGDKTPTPTENTRPADTVVAPKDQKVKQIELSPDEKVVGRGKAIGTVYQLADGRTVVVREPQP